MSSWRRGRTHCQDNRSGSRNKLLRYESLENRLLLYAVTGYQWANTNVSASLMPDGSSAEGYSSSLFAQLNAVAPTEVWQKEFARALQSWANASPLNFHLVSDNGSPSDAAGLVQGDTRFGDIRMGSHPRTDSYVAYTYYPVNWATLGGDLFLNSATTFRVGAALDLYSTLVHELGHSIGLGHSTSGTVMYPYIGLYSGLAADDVAGIQAIYGARQADAFDKQASNDTAAAATAITADASGAVNLSADLTTMADADYYRLAVPVGSDGTLSLSIDCRDYSLLAPKLLVYDAQGALVAQADSAGAYQSQVTVSLAGLAPGQIYTIVADGSTSDAFGMGAYRLSAQFGGSFQPPAPAPTPDPTPAPSIAADRYEANDTLATASNLGKTASVSKTGLTIHKSNDVDHYKFTAKTAGTYTISVATTEEATLTVLDGTGKVLGQAPTQPGAQKVAVTLKSGQKAVVKVAAGPSAKTAAYDLAIQQSVSSGGLAKTTGKAAKLPKGQIAKGSGASEIPAQAAIYDAALVLDASSSSSAYRAFNIADIWTRSERDSRRNRNPESVIAVDLLLTASNP